MFKITKKSGFTLIELMVVMAIIGILSSAVLASLTNTRIKSRDARRLEDIEQIRRAIELYYTTNMTYPPYYAQTSSSNCGTNWCTLETALAPYIAKLPRDPKGLQTDNRYYYDADSGDGYQSYVLMARFETSEKDTLEQNDGGYYNWLYEIGAQPRYCKEKYNGTSWDSGTSVCAGGN